MIVDNVVTYYQGIFDGLGGQFIAEGPIVWFTTHRRSLVRFNGVLLTRASSENLAAVCDPVLNAFFSNKLPFFWADFPPGTSPGLGQLLAANNIPLAIKGMPIMRRSLNALPPSPPLEMVEIVEVHSDQDQTDWLDVHMEGFSEPPESTSDFKSYLEYTLSTPKSRWRHFIARWDGAPCAISTLLCAQKAAGIYHVATLPEYRGRGLGKALTLAVMQAACEIGYSTAVLFATADGYPLYRKMGFETVETVDFYARL